VLPALVCWVCQPRLIKISGFFPVLVGYVTWSFLKVMHLPRNPATWHFAVDNVNVMDGCQDKWLGRPCWQ
jgi:hypothetical protein